MHVFRLLNYKSLSDVVAIKSKGPFQSLVFPEIVNTVYCFCLLSSHVLIHMFSHLVLSRSLLCPPHKFRSFPSSVFIFSLCMCIILDGLTFCQSFDCYLSVGIPTSGSLPPISPEFEICIYTCHLDVYI